jgi:hypothetical protein
MQNLESRKESVERGKVLKMAKAINHFVDGYQIEQDSNNRGSPGSGASHREDCRKVPAGSRHTQDEGSPSVPEGFHIMTSSVTEEALDAGAAGGPKTIVSKAKTATEEENIDSKDRRDRDLVYARASYLIREGLAMQGWSVYHSNFQ